MISLEGIEHRAFDNYCYALDEEHLVISLKTGKEVERVWLLCDADGSVLWVVGLRASALAPVTRTTASVLRLRSALFEK